MNFDWTIVRDIVIIVLAVLVNIYLLPWLKAKLGEAEYRVLWDRVCVLVQAAQQLFPKGEDGVKTGEQKLEYVATRLLEDYGVEMTPAVRALAEAAVHELTDL